MRPPPLRMLHRVPHRGCTPCLRVRMKRGPKPWRHRLTGRKSSRLMQSRTKQKPLRPILPRRSYSLANRALTRRRCLTRTTT
jgi:hypothetical protein